MKDPKQKPPDYLVTDWNCHACERGFWEKKHLKSHLGAMHKSRPVSTSSLSQQSTPERGGPPTPLQDKV
jgi:hypothetical protein